MSSGVFSKLIVISAVIAVIGYTVAVFYLQFSNANTRIPDSLTVAWFAFWTGEMLALAGIKVTKEKQ